MEALVLHGPGKFNYHESWPRPEPREGWSLVKVKYSGICGSDLPRMLVTGAYHHPLICGHEFMGVVEDLYLKSDRFKTGDKIAVLPLIPCKKCPACKEGEYFHCKCYNFLGSRTNGGFAEYCLVPEENLFHLPKELDERIGSFIEPISVALHVLRRSGFKPGEKALVLGAGTIGLLIAMWLKIFGAAKIVVADLRKESLEIAMRIGVETVNPMEDRFKKMGEFDASFEAAGDNSALISAIERSKRKGTITIVGRDTKDTIIPQKVLEHSMRKELTVRASWGYDNEGENEFIYEMLKEERFNIAPLITKEIPLKDGEKIIRQMANKELFFCKVLFVFK